MASTTSFADTHFKKYPKEQGAALLKTIKEAERLFPKAERAISYGMPTLKIGDDYLCHFEGFKKHNSLFPSSGSISELFEKELSMYEVSKGTIHFPLDKPFPTPLLKKLLLARLNQINESYPKKNGTYIQYYKNGGIQSEGKYKAGTMNGAWKFYRLDGSIMRSGFFKNGQQSGTWTTYAANGRVVKTTEF